MGPVNSSFSFLTSDLNFVLTGGSHCQGHGAVDQVYQHMRTVHRLKAPGPRVSRSLLTVISLRLLFMTPHVGDSSETLSQPLTLIITIKPNHPATVLSDGPTTQRWPARRLAGATRHGGAGQGSG